MHRKLEGRIAVVRPDNNGGVANTDAPSMLRGHGYVIMQVVTVHGKQNRLRVDVETLKIECCVGASVRADVPPEDSKDYYSDAPPRGTIPILGSRVDIDKIRFSPVAESIYA